MIWLRYWIGLLARLLSRRDRISEKEEPELKISASALTRTQHKEPEVSQFGRYEPPPGVIPEGDRQQAMAMDATPYDYVNQVYVNNYFPGYQFLAYLAQLPEYRKFAEVPAKDMIRKWVKLNTKSDAKEDRNDKIGLIEKALVRYKVRNLFGHAAMLDALYGRAQLYIDVKSPRGNDPKEDRTELESPLFIDASKIKKGSLLGFRLIEPVWTYPSAYNASNPLNIDFYKPSRWYVMGDTVHNTRMLTFVSRPVPDLLKAAYNFGGISMSQMAMPYVQNWLRTRDSVSDLVHSFSTSGLKTNLASVLQGGDDAEFLKRVELFNNLRDNRGMMLLDKDTEDFFQFNVPLGGLHELQSQAQEHMSSVSNIPLVKLLGVTPSGLNASSDGEIQVYYDWIGSQQETIFRDNLQKVLQIIQLSEFGEIDETIGFEFESLYGVDEVEASTIRKTDSERDAVLVNAGIVSPDEARQRIAADPQSGFDGLEGELDLDETGEE